MELCTDTGSKAACYHMARFFEKKGDYKQAISLFQQASAISNAMRLCRVCHIEEIDRLTGKISLKYTFIL